MAPRGGGHPSRRSRRQAIHGEYPVCSGGSAGGRTGRMSWRVRTARGTLDVRQFAGTIWYFVSALRPHWLRLTGAFVATLFTIGLSLAAPWPVQVVLDHVILGRAPKP